MSRMRTSKKCSKHLERVTHLKKTTNRHEIRKYGKALMQVRAFFLACGVLTVPSVNFAPDRLNGWVLPGRRLTGLKNRAGRAGAVMDTTKHRITPPKGRGT